MYCKNCGYKNNDDSDFCLNCGTKINKDIVSNQNVNLPNKKSISFKIVIIIIIYVLAIIIGFLLLFYNFEKNPPKLFETEYQEMHSKEELLSIIDNLDCSKNNDNHTDYKVRGEYTTSNVQVHSQLLV